jgi:hypothetical protein
MLQVALLATMKEADAEKMLNRLILNGLLVNFSQAS